MADVKQEDKSASPLAIFLACILQGQSGSFALCTSSQPFLNRGLVQAIAESRKALSKKTRLEALGRTCMPRY